MPQVDKRDVLAVSFAIDGAVLTGILYVMTGILLPTVGLILIIGLGLGAFRPHRSWVWGMILGIGVPAACLISQAAGLTIPADAQANTFFTFFTLLPALAGTSSGVALRHAYLKANRQ
jgi:hypothetical protein